MLWEDFTFSGSPIKRRLGFDEETQKIVVESCQPNMNECLEMNQAILNAERSSSSLWAGRDEVCVAQIPLWLLEKWRVEEDVDFLRWNDEDKAKIMRKLNDWNEYGKLRTAPGRI